MNDRDERITCCFTLMEYDNVSDRQHDILISLEEQYLKNRSLSDAQLALLESIFKQAAEK